MYTGSNLCCCYQHDALCLRLAVASKHVWQTLVCIPYLPQVWGEDCHVHYNAGGGIGLTAQDDGCSGCALLHCDEALINRLVGVCWFNFLEFGRVCGWRLTAVTTGVEIYGHCFMLACTHLNARALSSGVNMNTQWCRSMHRLTTLQDLWITAKFTPMLLTIQLPSKQTGVGGSAAWNWPWLLDLIFCLEHDILKLPLFMWLAPKWLVSLLQTI